MNTETSFQIKIGQAVVSEGHLQIGTKLDSSVIVCLYVPSKQMGGAVFYALPDQLRVESIIAELEEASGVPCRLFKAKVVGGSTIGVNSEMASRNVALALRILKSRQIELISKDVGGLKERKIIFHTDTGRLQLAYVEDELKKIVKELARSITPAPSKVKPIITRNKKIKVLIVDDSRTMRVMISKMLEADPDIEVIGTADDTFIAESFIAKQKPDVMTLDINMPGRDGVTFLKEIMKKNPIPTLMISSLNLQDGNAVMDALELGAVDYVQKASKAEMEIFSQQIREKVRIVSQVSLSKLMRKAKKVAPVLSSVKRGEDRMNAGHILVIGASTGGTEAIKDVLMDLPEKSPPIVIVQHIPPVFSKAFSDRMNVVTRLNVKEAEDGDVLAQGKVLIAPGGKQMKLVQEGGVLLVRITDDGPVNRHKPSVDYLFDSVADVMGKKAVGVILTGMGADGAKGLKRMKDKGARTIGQDEESCVVYGMPKSAFEVGAVDEVHSLQNISGVLIDLFQLK